MHARFKPTAATVIAALALGGCVEQSPDVPTEEDVRVAKENILAAPPASIRYPVNANLEGKVTYLGMDVDTPTVTPGKPFTLTHYWKVNEALGDDWKLFVHLEGPGQTHLNADHVPIAGKYPVHSWKKGDVIRDIHRVSVPATWKANVVEIYTGMWKGPLRLKVSAGPSDGQNRILAARLPTEVTSAPAPRKRLVATRVKPGSIKLDGKLDEPVWKSAASTGLFVRSTDGAKAEQATEAKVLWDDKYLYVGFTMEDSDVWTTMTARDDKLWTQEAVEMFIDADGDGKTYIELQTNPKGAIFDSYLPGYRANQNDFDAGMKVAVHVDGTVDKRDDTDKGWSVEMQIPFEAAKGKEKEMRNVPPTVGTLWRVNFFRMDMNKGKPQTGTAWSPPLVGDFHVLDKFGELVFGDDQGKVAVAPVGVPMMPRALPGGGIGVKTDPKAQAVKLPAAGGSAH
jgi:hypothetical protein